MINAMRCLSGVLAAAATLLTGCFVPILPDPPDESTRAQFGTMAAYVRPEPLRWEFQSPVQGWLAGLGFGFLRGAASIVYFALSGAGAAGRGASGDATASALAVAVGAAFGAGLGALYLPPSTLAAAVTAESSDRVAAARTAIDASLASADPASDLRTRFLHRARMEAGRDILPLDRDQVPHSERGPDYRGLAARNLDTVLELAVQRAAAGGSLWGFTANPRLTLALHAHARVIRVRDGAVLYATSITHLDPGRARTLVQWAEGDAVRAELELAAERLAAKLVEEIFLLVPYVRYGRATP